MYKRQGNMSASGNGKNNGQSLGISEMDIETLGDEPDVYKRQVSYYQVVCYIRRKNFISMEWIMVQKL